MVEQLIRSYLENCNTYDGYLIENIESVGHIVTFDEVSPCGHYRNHQKIELIELIAWVYGGQK